MPKIHQPFSLLEICYRASGKFVYDNLCCKIERMYGGYNQTVCVTVVTIVQRYLLDLLLSMTDNVSSRVLKRHLLLNTLTDCRIMYALIIHKSMQSLSILGNHCKIGSHTFHDFILKRFPFLTNLTHLNLRGIVFTPEILDVVVHTSKMLRSLIVEMPGLCSSNKISNSEFAQLSQLKHLRILKDASGHNFKDIDFQVVLNLLIVLKDLKQIDYLNIGHVLDHYVQSAQCPSSTIECNSDIQINALSLTHIKLIASFTPVHDKMGEVVGFEQDPSPNIIFSVAQSCPKLDHLELLNFEESNDEIHDQFLENLTASSIQVSSLLMDGFVINHKFEHFLKEKGKYLKTFLLSPLQINSSEVEKLQLLCPNVTNLRFSNSSEYEGLPQFSNINFCIIGGI